MFSFQDTDNGAGMKGCSKDEDMLDAHEELQDRWMMEVALRAFPTRNKNVEILFGNHKQTFWLERMMGVTWFLILSSSKFPGLKQTSAALFNNIITKQI